MNCNRKEREIVREKQNAEDELNAQKYKVVYNNLREDLYKDKKKNSAKSKMNRNEEVNKLLQSIENTEQKQIIKDDFKMRNILERDVTLFCIVHQDLKDDFFKLYVNNLIETYRKDGITYLIKIYSHIPYECTLGIDCFTEDSNITVLNGLYTRGNVHRVEESSPISMEQVDSFFKFKKDFYCISTEEDLKRVSLLVKNEIFTIFEIISL